MVYHMTLPPGYFCVGTQACGRQMSYLDSFTWDLTNIVVVSPEYKAYEDITRYSFTDLDLQFLPWTISSLLQS